MTDADEPLQLVLSRRARVDDRDLRGGVLRDADLQGLRGDRLDLRGTTLAGALLGAARLEACDLSHAWLDGADLERATLRMCSLDGVRGARLRAASVRI